MTNIYRLNNYTAKDAAKVVYKFLENSENMETQCLTSLDDEIFIQARIRHGKYKKLLGLDKTIAVKIKPIGTDFFSIEIGESKWADKGVAFTTSFFFFWPLAVTAGVGTYKQKTLPDKIITELEKTFSAECKIN